jgi:glycosyltransferase involved in cell wall biosynthesis
MIAGELGREAPGAAPAGMISLHGFRAPAAGSPAGLHDCTLVVPTYRRPAEMVSLLRTLADLPDPPGEVVVVDGSGGDETRDAVLAWTSTARASFSLLFVKSPPGLTRQRNVGIDASTGEFIFFLDDDCVPLPGYFRAIRSVFTAEAPRNVGAVCGSIINALDKPLTPRWRIRFLLRLVPPRGEYGKYYPTATSVPMGLTKPFSGVRAVDIMPGGAAAYRREVFDRNRFSRFFYGYSQGEDMEMSLRIGREWTLLWCGDAHVLHNHVGGGRPDLFQKGLMEVRNRYFIWKRHSPGMSLAVRFRFWSDIAYVFALDLGGYISHPLTVGFLAHAAGVLKGIAVCIVFPPRYEEPVARREYECIFDGN